MPALYHAVSVALALWVAHDFHISRLTVNLDARQGRTEVTLHTFVDDVELAVARYHRLDEPPARRRDLPTAATLDFLAPTEHPLADSLVEAYLRAKVRLTSEAPLPALTYLGTESADDPYAVYFYFAAPLPPSSTELSVASDFFVELYDDQQNVVVWQRDGESDGYALLTDRERVSTYLVGPTTAE